MPRPRRLPLLIYLAALAVVPAAPLAAQTTGNVIGRVVDAETDEPIAGALVRFLDLPARAATGADGRFVVVAVPAGEQRLRVELLGFAPHTELVQVRAGRIGDVGTVRLAAAPVPLEGLTVAVERLRLIEPEITVSHEVLLGRELRELPIDAVSQALELAPGVADGHFRGGRIGQEVYVVDGIELKNQLEASTQGFGLELSPTSLEEVEIVTGGFGVEYGSALSGVVSFVTRRGNPRHWEGRAGFTTDHWAPGDLFLGFTQASVSAGGPLRFLGEGTTLFADLLLQGMLDAEPRARGLGCLRPEDDAAIGDLIDGLLADPATAHLYCPYRSHIMPHQRGEKAIAFARLDRPLLPGVSVTASLLRNRLQRQLYTPEFKYNPTYQLGQRTEGTLGMLALDWAAQGRNAGVHVTARGSLLRLDRHLGALDPASLEALDLAGFTGRRYRFLGEDYVRLPLDEQLDRGMAVPGYIDPGGSAGSPFGPAAEGIFFTEGTPHLANWSRSEMAGADLVGELISSHGSALRLGTSAKFYRVENYERVHAHLAGSTPNFARFFPATFSTFLETRLAAAEDITVQLGVRYDAFRSGIGYREVRADFLSPVIDTEWKHSVMPRVAVAGPVPGTDRRTAFRFSYGLVSQPPDFRYFLDSTLGDSLRTDLRRQGNPDLVYERGSAWEVGISQIVLRDAVGMGLTVFRKELSNLVTGSLELTGSTTQQFTTGDHGNVSGAELSVRGQWRAVRLRGAYAWQKAVGVGSSALEDTVFSGTDPRTEYPLAFDRRHTGSLALGWGQAAGVRDARWSGSVVSIMRSGQPLDRFREGDPLGDENRALPLRMPWTATIDARISRDLGAAPGCRRCRISAVADGRNALGRDNLLGLRRDSGRIAPPVEAILREMDGAPPNLEPIPRESPRYSPLIDFDQDGLITAGEYRTARLAAALDRYDPSLYFAEPRQLRLGLEIAF
jgi:hypothetical protein